MSFSGDPDFSPYHLLPFNIFSLLFVYPLHMLKRLVQRDLFNVCSMFFKFDGCRWSLDLDTYAIKFLCVVNVLFLLAYRLPRRRGQLFDHTNCKKNSQWYFDEYIKCGTRGQTNTNANIMSFRGYNRIIIFLKLFDTKTIIFNYWWLTWKLTSEIVKLCISTRSSLIGQC